MPIPPDVFPMFPPASCPDALITPVPCGLSLGYSIGDDRPVVTNDLDAWGVRLHDVERAAANNDFSYLWWKPLSDHVYFNNDGCWPAVVLDPWPYVEHNEVVGSPVLLIISSDDALLTGSGAPAGLAEVKARLPNAIAENAFVLTDDWPTWVPFS